MCVKQLTEWKKERKEAKPCRLVAYWMWMKGLEVTG